MLRDNFAGSLVCKRRTRKPLRHARSHEGTEVDTFASIGFASRADLSAPYYLRYKPTPGPIGQSNVPHSRSSSVQAMRKPIAYGIISAMIVPIPALGS